MELSPYRQQMSILPRLLNSVEEGFSPYHSNRLVNSSDYKKYFKNQKELPYRAMTALSCTGGGGRL